MSAVIEIQSLFSIKSITVEKAEKGQFFFKALATTSDIDLTGDIVTEQAMVASEDDLLRNSTIFLNHDKTRPVGHVTDARFRPDVKGIEFIGIIDNTEPEIQSKIKSGTLSKISIGAVVMDHDKVEDETTGKMVLRILRMLLKEVSLVGGPANPEARTLSWWIAKSEELANKDHKEEPVEIIKDEALGRKVRELREARGWTRDQLGDRIGITGSTVGQIERGEIEAPPGPRLERLARAFGISLRSLVSGTGLASMMRTEKGGEYMGKEKQDTEVIDDTETPKPDLKPEPVVEIDVDKEMKDIEEAELQKLETAKQVTVQTRQLGRLMDMIMGMDVPDGAKKAAQQAKSIIEGMAGKKEFAASKSLGKDEMQTLISTAVKDALKEVPKTTQKSEPETPKVETTTTPDRDIVVRKGEGREGLPEIDTPKSQVEAIGKEVTAANESGGSGLTVLAEKGLLFQKLG